MSPAGFISSLLLLVFVACPGPAPAQPLPPIRTIFVIMMENTRWSDIKENTNAPFINGTLLPMASHCEFYNNLSGIHPSLPNYLWIEAGTNFGIFDDGDPAQDHQNTTNHLVTLLNQAGISWKVYQENISPTNLPLQTCCGFSARHNPFVYFDDVTGTNNPSDPYGLAHIRPFSELAGDLANDRVARYNFIIPTDCHDMHTSCYPLYNRMLQGDLWLSNQVPAILNSPAFTNGVALFIAWDETDDDTNAVIPLLLISPFARGAGYASFNYHDHSSLLRTFQDLFGVQPLLGAAATATNLSDLFWPFGFSDIRKTPGGAIRLTLSGLSPGRTNIVQASADLADWADVSTNVATGTTMNVTDHTAANLSHRFYRLLELR
jgi:phosphatidylinositol-3-phosphatase